MNRRSVHECFDGCTVVKLNFCIVACVLIGPNYSSIRWLYSWIVLQNNGLSDPPWYSTLVVIIDDKGTGLMVKGRNSMNRELWKKMITKSRDSNRGRGV